MSRFAMLLTAVGLAGCFTPYGEQAPPKQDAAQTSASTSPVEGGGAVVASTSGDASATTSATAPITVCKHATCLDFEDATSKLAPFMNDDSDGTCVVADGSLSCKDRGLTLTREVNGATLSFDAFVDGPRATAASAIALDFGRIRLASASRMVDISFRASFAAGKAGVIELFVVYTNGGAITQTDTFPTTVEIGRWHHFEIHYERSKNGFAVTSKADSVFVLDDGFILDDGLTREQILLFGEEAPYGVKFDNVALD